MNIDDDDFAELRERATVLAARTESLNALIERIETALAEANPGVAVWHEKVIAEHWEVGYKKLGQHWCFVVRNATSPTPIVQALLKSNRQVRLEAVPLLPEIVALLKVRVNEFIVNVDRLLGSIE